MVVGHGTSLGDKRSHVAALWVRPSSCFNESRWLHGFTPSIAPCFLHRTSHFILKSITASRSTQVAVKLHASVERRPAQPRDTPRPRAPCVPSTGQCPPNAVCAYAPAADVETTKRAADDAEKMSQPQSNPPYSGGPPSAAPTARAALCSSVARAFNGR